MSVITKVEAGIVADAIRASFIYDPDGNNENIVDVIGKVATQLKYLGNGNAGTTMGAIEAHGLAIKESAQLIAHGLDEIASAINRLADVDN